VIAPLDDFVSRVNGPTAVAAALLVLAAIVVIRIGKVLLLAAIFGLVTGAVSLSQGNPPGTAAGHAIIGFAAATVTLFLVRLSKSPALWLLVTAAGVVAIMAYGFRS
jgi:hypothetical protein